jgi:hypothetical protein
VGQKGIPGDSGSDRVYLLCLLFYYFLKAIKISAINETESGRISQKVYVTHHIKSLKMKKKLYT